MEPVPLPLYEKEVAHTLSAAGRDLRPSGEPLTKTFPTVLRRGGRERAAEKGDPPIAAIAKQITGEAPPLYIVGRNGNYRHPPARSAEGLHHGEASGKAQAWTRARRWSDDDATITPSTRTAEAYRMRRTGARAREVHEQRAQPVLLQMAREEIEDLHERRIIEIVRDKTDQVGASGGETPRKKVRLITDDPVASNTLSRVAEETLAPLVKARETADTETPASSATSRRWPVAQWPDDYGAHARPTRKASRPPSLSPAVTVHGITPPPFGDSVWPK